MKNFFIKQIKTEDISGRECVENKLRVGRVVVTSIILLIIIVCLIGSFRIIPTGYTGIRITGGQVSDYAIDPGLHFKIPIIQKIIKINNKQQNMSFNNEKIWAESSERTAVSFENITVTYTIISSESAWIYSNVSNYKSNLIDSGLVSSSIKTAAKTLNSTDVTNRGIIESKVAESLQESLNNKYDKEVLRINKVILGNIEFEDTYNDAIAKKQNAQLAYEQQQIANKQAVEKAEADAEVKKKAAQAEADAIIIKAQAEADANKKINDSLSDKVLAKEYYDKWNGQLPTYYGSNGGILLQTPIK